MQPLQGAVDNPKATPRPVTRRPGSRARPLMFRLVLSLALFPIVPCGCLVLMLTVDRCWGLRWAWFDYSQFLMLCLTVGITLISLCIWRACVVWTAGRYAATVIVTAIPIAQVLWWQPLWDAGCANDVLRSYQSVSLVGLWVWATVWVWWGWAQIGLRRRWRIRMTDSAKRVLLSFGLLPIIVGGYWVTGIFIDDVFSEDDGRLVFCVDVLAVAIIPVLLALMLLTPSGLSTRRQRIGGCIAVLLGAIPFLLPPVAIFDWPHNAPILIFLNTLWSIVAALLWFLIWRSAVVWSWGVRLRTELAVVVFVGIARVAPHLPDNPDALDCLRYTLPMMAWGGWMIATTLFWRYRRTAPLGEMVENLRCQSCGYSLRGLYGTRCPECGEQPTLDELVTAVLDAEDA
ncbi:MAG: hypothetical protein KAV82_10235 [Phycisphaerae bacterium]|nr:hypothetical protein [Phycisphaerae bacterium]